MVRQNCHYRLVGWLYGRHYYLMFCVLFIVVFLFWCTSIIWMHTLFLKCNFCACELCLLSTLTVKNSLIYLPKVEDKIIFYVRHYFMLALWLPNYIVIICYYLFRTGNSNAESFSFSCNLLFPDIYLIYYYDIYLNKIPIILFRILFNSRSIMGYTRTRGPFYLYKIFLFISYIIKFSSFSPTLTHIICFSRYCLNFTLLSYYVFHSSKTCIQYTSIKKYT